MSTHNILFSIYKKENHTKFAKSAAKGLFPGDSRIPFSIYKKENHTKFAKSAAKGLFPGDSSH